METNDGKIIRLEDRVARLESNAESEKETRSERNREFDKRVDKLESRIRTLEDKDLIHETKDKLIGKLYATIYTLAGIIIGLVGLWVAYSSKK